MTLVCRAAGRSAVRSSAICRLSMLQDKETDMAVGREPAAGACLLLCGNVHNELSVLLRTLTSRHALALCCLPECLLPVYSSLGCCAQPEQYVAQFLRVREIRSEAVLQQERQVALLGSRVDTVYK